MNVVFFCYEGFFSTLKKWVKASCLEVINSKEKIYCIYKDERFFSFDKKYKFLTVFTCKNRSFYTLEKVDNVFEEGEKL